MDAKNTKRWVYAGKRDGTSGKVVQVWYDVESSDDGDKVLMDRDHTTLFAGKPLVLNCRPGQMWEVTQSPTDETKYITSGVNGPKFVGLIDDDSLRTQWAAATLDAECRFRARKDVKETPTTDEIIRKCLEPIRAQMRKTDAIGQRVIAAAVMKELFFR